MPEPIGLHEAPRQLSAVIGRGISFVPETDEQARARRAGAEQWQVDGRTGSYQAIATGEASVTSHTVEHVTGTRSWAFAEFLRREPDAWRDLVR